MTLIETISNAARELRICVMNDLRLFQSGGISARDARTRAQMAKVALDSLKIEVIASPLAVGFVRNPDSAVPQLSAAE